MVFKRYIRKHGKKLGPYYYENVRGPDGRVKTIYVGTNPSILKDIETRQKEEERRKNQLETKNKVREFFHRIGLYKMPEEKREIELQIERERQERLIWEEGLRKQIERKREEEKRKIEEYLRKQIELAKQKAEMGKEKAERELKRHLELDAKQKEKERRKKTLKRKNKIREFFHRIGLYKTPEEKREIALEKERKKQEKLRKKEEYERRKYEELEKKGLQRQKELEKQERWEARKDKFRKFLHKFGLYLTPEEKRQIELQKEKERQEKERLKQEEQKRQEELIRQKELVRQRAEDEKRKQLEELKRKKELEEKKTEAKKAKWFEKLFKREKRAKLEVETTKEVEKPKEKKPSIFSALITRIEKREEKPKAQEISEPKPSLEREFEDLEEAIKELGLFKKIESETLGIEEKPKKKFGLLKKRKPSEIKKKEGPKELKAKEKTTGKSKGFGECYEALHDAKEYMNKNDVSKAKKLYIKARDIYVRLNNDEKKELHGELMNLYNRLK